MAKHDIRTAQTQANELINIIINDPLMISSLLRYRESHDFTNARDIPDLLKVQSLIASSSSTMPDWIAGSYELKELVLHEDGGVKYVYQSLIDDNETEPSPSNASWNLIGGAVQKAYAGPNAPAGSLGNNGDLYYIVPNDSSYIELRQKISGAWVAVFTLPIPPTRVENIPFTGATGTFTINFLTSNRQALFPNPIAEAWAIDGNTDTLIPGISMVKNKLSGLIQTVVLDGVFGSGYINLINR